jgi:hypothetical protein
MEEQMEIIVEESNGANSRENDSRMKKADFGQTPSGKPFEAYLRIIPEYYSERVHAYFAVCKWDIPFLHFCSRLSRMAWNFGQEKVDRDTTLCLLDMELASEMVVSPEVANGSNVEIMLGFISQAIDDDIETYYNTIRVGLWKIGLWQEPRRQAMILGLMIEHQYFAVSLITAE